MKEKLELRNPSRSNIKEISVTVNLKVLNFSDDY
jgi:hypothetical protein